MKIWNLRINGKEVETSEMFDVVSPYTLEPVAKVCQAGYSECELAVSSAVEAFKITRKQPVHERSRILTTIADILERMHSEVSDILSLEIGKPISFARIEVDRAINTFRLASAYALTLEGTVLNTDVIKLGDNKTSIVKRFPIGPIAAITPYNLPLNMAAGKIAPVILAGNTVVLKPSPLAPLTSLILSDVCWEAGVPDGQINVIPCTIPVAQSLITDDRIKLVTFTGSADVGWELKSKCGRKKICLELGGNAAVIVEPDADYEKIIPKLITGSYCYAGQICISVQRIFVNEQIFNAFIEKFLGEVKKMKLFDINDDKVVCGPMISDKEAERAESWIREAVSHGAKLLIGGKREGNRVYPAVLTNTDPQMKVNCREVFAPIVTIEKYSGFDEAVSLVNNSEFGIHAGVYTNDIGKMFRAFNDLETGGVLINECPMFRVDNIPYGGVKGSGMGREGLKYAYEEMTELKHLTINLA